MKKVFLFLIFSGLILPFASLAQEKIDNFEVTIKINPDAVIEVSERIEYDFGLEQRHGIYRDIPIKYQARGGNYNLRIFDISVTDQNGNHYSFNKSSSGQNIKIKIGDPDKFVSGKKTYIINYKIKRAINYFDSYDELYWNATGNGWSVPINKSSTNVILPQKIKKDKIQANCFAGSFGSQAPCLEIDYQSDASELVEAINFSQPSFLAAGQGLTIVVGWPKGIVAKPSLWQNIFDTVKDNWILALPLITFFAMFSLWWSRGRDPKGRGAIYPQYDSPDNLTPAQIGTLIDEKVDSKDISSEIVYLAIQGYLKITRVENKGIIFKQEDYLFEKLKEANDLPSFEKRLIDSLFAHGNHRSIKLSDLKKTFSKELLDIKNQIYDSLVSKGYFPEKPLTTQSKYIISDVLILFGVILIAKLLIGTIGILAIGSLIASGILIIIFGSLMPAKTKKGVETKENIFGLKMYLEVAEKDRIKFYNAPEKNPEHFEKLLPYAMVLGVEKQWAEQFKDIYNQPPAWYNDPTSRTINSIILINSLNNFNHSANSALFSAPRGASGGGFSGGGFGGGGGGSW